MMRPACSGARNLSRGVSIPRAFMVLLHMNMLDHMYFDATGVRTSRIHQTAPLCNASRRYLAEVTPVDRSVPNSDRACALQTGMSSTSGHSLRSRRILGTLEHSCDAVCTKMRWREYEDRNTKYGVLLGEMWSDAATNRDSHSPPRWPIAKWHRIGLIIKTDAAVTLFEKLGGRSRRYFHSASWSTPAANLCVLWYCGCPGPQTKSCYSNTFV